MEQKQIYRVILTFTYDVEADDTADADEKAREYLEEHSEECISQISSRTVWVEE